MAYKAGVPKLTLAGQSTAKVALRREICFLVFRLQDHMSIKRLYLLIYFNAPGSTSFRPFAILNFLGRGAAAISSRAGVPELRIAR